MKIEDVLPYIRDKSAYTLKEAEELRLLTWDEINKVQDLAEKNKILRPFSSVLPARYLSRSWLIIPKPTN